MGRERTASAHALQRIRQAATGYPYPLAATCRRYLDTPPSDLWHEWEVLSRDVLGPVLSYLSHLLLSDLVATGRQPAHLFHRIQAVLSRPLTWKQRTKPALRR